MAQTEYDYRELQKMNEHLRRENHLLRLLDELQREARDAGTSTSVPVSGSQDTSVEDTPVEDTGIRSAGTESQGTLIGDADQKMDVDVHCDKPEEEHKHPEEKEKKNKDKEEEEEEEEEEDDDEEEEEEEEEGDEDKNKEEKEEEEEENSQYDDSNASDAQPESTCLSNCTDEDSKDQDEDEGVPAENLIRGLHRCNPRAHRNAVLSLCKRNVFGSKTLADDLHIKLHQDLRDCSCVSVLVVGQCKFDATLYMASESNPYKRTDVWTYQKLYGLHPALVMWIDYQPTLRLLDRHAEIIASPYEKSWSSAFLSLFDSFINILVQQGCLSGYLDDTPYEQNPMYSKENIAAAYNVCVEALGY